MMQNDAEKCQKPSVLPRHIGVIMDGNGRWAQKQGLSRSAGHKAGAKVFKEISLYAAELGVEFFTVYAFSTENWKRPKAEVNTLILLFEEYLKDAIEHFSQKNIRVRFWGETSQFSQRLQNLIRTVEDNSADHTGMTLNICLNYGGRNELANAVRKISEKVKNGELSPEQITEDTISEHLYFPDEPDADLIIRPSGEYRLSNFLLWQSAYSEFVFMNVLWPDFTPELLNEAINEYNKRNRRFGSV